MANAGSSRVAIYRVPKSNALFGTSCHRISTPMLRSSDFLLVFRGDLVGLGGTVVELQAVRL